MRDKVNALKDYRYSQDYLLVASLIWHWRKLRPDNEELKAAALAIADMHKYVQGLQSDLKILEEIMNNKETP